MSFSTLPDPGPQVLKGHKVDQMGCFGLWPQVDDSAAIGIFRTKYFSSTVNVINRVQIPVEVD